MSKLLMEKGGRATLEQVLVRPVPLRDTSTYQPIYNDELLDMVYRVADDYGLKLVNPEYGLARNGQRMFGVFEIQGHEHLGNAVKLMLGVRNSFDASLSAGICFGSKVMVCSNLVFTGYANGEDGIVGKCQHKHTLNVEDTLYKRLVNSIGKFRIFKNFQENFYKGLGARYISDETAYTTMIEAVRADAVPKKDIMRLADKWLESGNPREFEGKENWHREFTGRNAWSLFNVFTENHKAYTEKNPVEANKRSINLTKLFHSQFMN